MRTLLVLLISALTCSASTVNLYITNTDTTGFSGPVKVFPIQKNVLADGSFSIQGVAQRATCTNGMASYPQLRGTYMATNDLGFCLIYAVPMDSGTYCANSNSLPGANIFTYRPGVDASTVAEMIAASGWGTNGGNPNAITNQQTGVALSGAFSGTVQGTVQGSVGKLVILEDDWPTDQDNMMELDYALKLMDEGTIKILATPFAGYGPSNLLAVPLADASCRYYGHPEIVQCASGLVTNGSGVATALWYGVPFVFSADICANFPSTYPTSTNYPTALATYRRLLEAAPTNSVTMIFGGPLANLWDLWRSLPDTNSLSTGAQLISNKVAEIILVAGVFPTNPPAGQSFVTDNLNFGSDMSWSWIVLTNMGVPVTFVPTSLGGSIPIINGVGPCGTIAYRPHSDLSYKVLSDWDNYWHHQAYLGNPALGDAPFQDSGIAYQGSSPWTQFAVMYAAYGLNYHGISIFTPIKGNMIFGGPGVSEGWNTNSTGNQQFLTFAQPIPWYHAYFSNYFGSVHNPPTPPTVLQNTALVPAPSNPAPPAPDYWFIADTLGGLVDGWQPVAMNDSSPSNNQLFKLAGYQAPGFKSGSANGHGSLYFTNSASQILVCSNNAMGQVFTIFAVVQPSATAVTSVHCIIGSEAGQNIEWRLDNGKQELMAAGVAQICIGNTTLSAGNWYVLAVTYDALGNWTMYINGSVDATGNHLVTLYEASRYPALGGVNASAPTLAASWIEFWDGGIAEAGRFPSVLGASDLNKLFNYLGNKYGITIGSDWFSTLPAYPKASRPTPIHAGVPIYQTDNTPGLRVWNGANWMRYTETAD